MTLASFIAKGETVLTGVSVSCFLLSYLIVLIVEALRFAFKVPGRSYHPGRHDVYRTGGP